MMRFSFIIAIAMAIAFIAFTQFSIKKVKQFGYDSFNAEMTAKQDSSGKNSATPFSSKAYDDKIIETTKNSAFASIGFCLYFLMVLPSARKKIKNQTMNIVTGAGTLLALGLIIWNIYAYTSPEKVDLGKHENDFGALGLLLLTPAIIGTVHAFRTKT